MRLLTEATATLTLLIVLALARGGPSTVRSSALLGGATFLSWVARPNLGVAAPAIVLASVFRMGPSRAFRSQPLWLYVGIFFALYEATVQIYAALHGHAPYAHYGVMAEIFRTQDIFYYQKEYVGAVDACAPPPKAEPGGTRESGSLFN